MYHARLFPMNTPITSASQLARAAALVLIGISLATSASAMSLRELRGLAKTGKQGPDYVNYYLVGIMEGVLEGHAQAVRQGATPTICLNGRRLEPSMAQSLFRAELRRNSDVYEADMPAQLVMLNALASSYTC